MKKIISQFLFLIILWCLTSTSWAASLQVQTALPPPVDGFDILKLSPRLTALADSECSPNEIGTVYYLGGGFDEIRICVAPGVWTRLGAYWSENDVTGDIYITSPSNYVGINSNVATTPMFISDKYAGPIDYSKLGTVHIENSNGDPDSFAGISFGRALEPTAGILFKGLGSNTKIHFLGKSSSVADAMEENFVYNQQGRLGFGTSTPSANMTIVDDSATFPHYPLKISQEVGGSSRDHSIGFDATGKAIFNSNTNDFRIRGDNPDLDFLKLEGSNVGIYHDSNIFGPPLEKLTVFKNMRTREHILTLSPNDPLTIQATPVEIISSENDSGLFMYGPTTGSEGAHIITKSNGNLVNTSIGYSTSTANNYSKIYINSRGVGINKDDPGFNPEITSPPYSSAIMDVEGDVRIRGKLIGGPTSLTLTHGKRTMCKNTGCNALVSNVGPGQENYFCGSTNTCAFWLPNVNVNDVCVTSIEKKQPHESHLEVISGMTFLKVHSGAFTADYDVYFICNPEHP